MKILVFVLFSLLVFGQVSAQSFNCYKQVSLLVKRNTSTLASLQSRLQETLVGNKEITKADLYRVFDELKREEEVFANVYTNRSELKRSMTESEVREVRDSYKLTNLSDEEVQLFYTNELSRQYSLIEEALREFEVRGLLTEIGLANDKDAHQALMQALITLRGSDLTSGMTGIGIKGEEYFGDLKSLTSEQAKAILVMYHSIKSGSGEAYDLHEVGLGQLEFSLKIAYRDNKKIQSVLCCRDGGCTFCPNNFGLLKKNKENGVPKL